MNTVRLRIFVAHAFRPKGDPYTLSGFRAALQQLVNCAKIKVRQRHGVRLQVETFFELTEFRGRLSEGIQSFLRTCDVAVADISDNEPNVLYELGFLHARRIPVLLIKARKSAKDFPRPEDLGDTMVCYYDTVDQIVQKLQNDFVNFLCDTVQRMTIREHEVESLWFSRQIESALIVAAPEPEPSRFANPSERNFIHLDCFEDRDALLELHGFLNRRAPWLRIDTVTCRNFAAPRTESNLIIIGGPGEASDPTDGNKACALFLSKHGRSRVRYGTDCESLIANRRTFRARTDATKRIIRDYGYFARFANPFNPRASVILINGIHTFGTLGAALAFSDHPLAHHNLEVLIQTQATVRKPNLEFEVTFPVDVHEGRAVCPRIDAGSIRFF
jgi:hypothetical protein